MVARRPVPPIDGVCVVDKPAGWTSHDVVAKARGLLGTRKVGHSGTLDPDATGVLVLGVGRATRLLRFLTVLGKRYVGEVSFGTTTSTLDAAGEVTGTFSTDGVDLESVWLRPGPSSATIDQVPPMVSAVKVGGRRLHELAREGVEIERAARSVVIRRIDVESTGDPSVFRLSVECGSGTYIRSLAADLGAALGSGAHLRSLRRTAVGGFTLEDARPLDALQLLPMREVLRDYPRLELDDTARLDLMQGRRLQQPWPAADPRSDHAAEPAADPGSDDGPPSDDDPRSDDDPPRHADLAGDADLTGDADLARAADPAGDADPALAADPDRSAGGGEGGQPVAAAYGPDGDLVAVVTPAGGAIRPLVVVGVAPPAGPTP